jgi:hypothetical protein
MAITTKTVSFAAAQSATFTFPTPAGNYGKTLGVVITDSGEPAGGDFLPDSAAGGTTTGTVSLSGPITGTAEIIIYDRI